jgi:hypothetical protein
MLPVVLYGREATQNEDGENLDIKYINNRRIEKGT